MVTFWQYRASRTNWHCHFLEVPFEKGIVLRWGGEDPVCPKKVLDNTITRHYQKCRITSPWTTRITAFVNFSAKILRKLAVFFVNKCYAQKKSGDVRQQYFPRYWKTSSIRKINIVLLRASDERCLWWRPLLWRQSTIPDDLAPPTQLFGQCNLIMMDREGWDSLPAWVHLVWLLMVEKYSDNTNVCSRHFFQIYDKTCNRSPPPFCINT